MALTISGNNLATANIIGQRQNDQSKSLNQLATGKKLNSAADGAAALMISQYLQAQIGGDQQASDNVDQASAMLQTADAGLGQTQSLLDQMRTLALQASSTATTDPSQQAALNQQFSQLGQALNQVANGTSFGASQLLDGSFTGQQVQTGNSAGQSLQVDISSNATGAPGGFDTAGLGLTGANLASPAAITNALNSVDNALNAVNQQRGNIGGLISDNLASISNSLGQQQVDLASANSTISDTDYAKAASDQVRNQILNQSGIAMLAQGNVQAGRVMKLLTG